MPIYKLQKKHRSSRRVEVRAERIDIHVPALLICGLLAFFIWLYIVGLSHLSAEVDNPSATPEQTTTEQESADSCGGTRGGIDPVLRCIMPCLILPQR